MSSPLDYCSQCGAANDHGAVRCASCGQALVSDGPRAAIAAPMSETPSGAPLQRTPPLRMPRRGAIRLAAGIAAGAVLLPIGGMAAYIAYVKITDPILVSHSAQYANAAAWSPDGTMVASAGIYGAQVWEALTDTRKLTVLPHDSLDDVVWSADGRRLLTLQQKFANPTESPTALSVTVEVWDIASGYRLQSILLTEPGYTGFVQVGLNEPYLAVVREVRAEDVAVAGGRPLQGHVIEIWDVAEGRMIAALTGLNGRFGPRPAQMFWAPDRHTLAVLYTDYPSSSVQVEIWEAPARQRLAAFTAPMAVRGTAVLPVAWSPDQKSLALGLDVYAIDSGLRRSTYKADGHTVEAVAWSPDGQRLAVATVARGVGLYAPAKNTIFVLAESNGSRRLQYDAGGSLTGVDLAFSPTSQYLLVTTNGNVEVWRSA